MMGSGMSLQTEEPVPPARPFDGLRLLDLTTTFGGSLASMHIADFGGDVVRVDALAHRTTPEQIVATRGKRFVDLRPASSTQRDEIIALARRADVVVIDQSPAALAESGLDAATLRHQNPRLIHLWMPPHSTKGDVAELPADELLLSAWTGIADQQPGALDQPVAPVVSVTAYEHGALGATAIVAALLRRQRTGLGRGITVSGLHAVAALNVSTMVDLPGILRPFAGEKSTTWGPPNYRVYRCADDAWLYLAALTAPFFIAAVDAMDMMDVMLMPGVDGEFLNVFLPDIKPVVGARLADRFMERTGAAWHEIFNAARVPSALVATREEWAASETVSAGGMLVEFDHETLGHVVFPGPAVELCASPARAEWLTDREALVDLGGVWADERPTEEREDIGTDDNLPLDGIRILDVSSFIAGPFTSSVLENFGATVYKVEQTAGDPFGQVARATYAALNRGKARVVLDLKDAEGLRSFHALAQGCDAVVDNMSFGSAERLGIDFETLARSNPQIVVCSVSAWGKGPLRNTPGFDPVLQARSGLMAAQGGDGEPIIQAVPVTDIGTGTLSAFGILTALFARESLGAGQQVRASLASTSLTFQAAEFTTFAGRPHPIVGDPAFLGESALHRLYRCADGWIALSADEHSFAVLRSLLEKKAEGREQAPDGIATALRVRTVREALAAAAEAGIPAVAAISRNQLFDDPRLLENDFFFHIDDAELGPVTAVRSYAEWEGIESPDVARTHGLGEDTARAIEGGWPPSQPR
jgi:crotonobetainyl-CoA:carnitine CoA-transferase CaiB-like acyl-CoA transferase